MTNRRFSVLLALTLGFMGAEWYATAGDSEALSAERLQRETLKGLSGVGVLVENLRADVEAEGLRKADILTDVELRLRKNGIKVLTGTEQSKAPATAGAPCLYVS